MKREFEATLEIPPTNPSDFFPNTDLKSEVNGWSFEDDWMKQFLDQDVRYDSNEETRKEMLLPKGSPEDEGKETVEESEKEPPLEKSTLSPKDEGPDSRSITPYKDYVSPPRRRRRKEEIRVPDDGYLWLKYGQKDLMGSSYTRAYYRCKEKEKGCPAKRTVDRQRSDTSIMQIVYEEDHNHLPTHAISDQTTSRSLGGFSPKSVQSGSSVVTLDSPRSVTIKRSDSCYEELASLEVTKATTCEEPDPSVVDTVLLKPMNQVLPNLGFSNKPTWTSYNPSSNHHYAKSSDVSQMNDLLAKANLFGFQTPAMNLPDVRKADYLKILLQAKANSLYELNSLSSGIPTTREALLSLLRDSKCLNFDAGVKPVQQPLQPVLQPSQCDQVLYPTPVSQPPQPKAFDPFAFLGGGDTLRLADFMTN